MRAIPMIGVAALMAATPGAAAAPSAQQLVAARQAGMHMAATLLFRGIKAAVANGSDVTQQVHEAEGIALWGAAIPGLFPAGSGHAESRARPEIWSNPADFAGKAARLEAAASRLAERAQAGDAAGFAAEAVLVEAACSACHSAYRSN